MGGVCVGGGKYLNNGRKQMLAHSTKKEANMCAQITSQSVLPPLYVNYLNHL